MKTVSKIQTFDGALHDTHGDGRRHLEKMLANIVPDLVHRLSNARYSDKVTMLAETELETLRQIIRITDDLGLEPSEE